MMSFTAFLSHVHFVWHNDYRSYRVSETKFCLSISTSTYILRIRFGWQWHLRYMNEWQQYVACERMREVNEWTAHILWERVNVCDMSLSSITCSICSMCHWSKQLEIGYTCRKIHWTTSLPYIVFCLVRVTLLKQLESQLIFSKNITLWLEILIFKFIYIHTYMYISTLFHNTNHVITRNIKLVTLCKFFAAKWGNSPL